MTVCSSESLRIVTFTDFSKGGEPSGPRRVDAVGSRCPGMALAPCSPPLLVHLVWQSVGTGRRLQTWLFCGHPGKLAAVQTCPALKTPQNLAQNGSWGSSTKYTRVIPARQLSDGRAIFPDTLRSLGILPLTSAEPRVQPGGFVTRMLLCDPLASRSPPPRSPFPPRLPRSVPTCTFAGQGRVQHHLSSVGQYLTIIFSLPVKAGKRSLPMYILKLIPRQMTFSVMI